MEALIKDLDKLSSIHCFSSLRLVSDIEYMRPNGGFPPSISGMAWSTYRRGGRVRASSSEKMDK